MALLLLFLSMFLSLPTSACLHLKFVSEFSQVVLELQS